MSLAEIQAEHRRLSILRLLTDAPGYAANESILDQALDGVGLPASRDQVRADLAWLAEQGLATTEAVGELTVARVTLRGIDVARGDAVVPGVKRPSPRG